MSNKTTITAAPGTPIILTERIFAAPREKVFRAFTQKELLEKWYAGPVEEAKIAIDLRMGGKWEFTNVIPGAPDVTFYGYFHDVTAPERLVQTAEFASVPERGHVVLERFEFIDLGNGTTKLVLTDAFLNLEDRDAALQSGMSEGVKAQHRKLDELLERTH